MIKLTRFTGAPFIVNAEYIKFVEETPDTMLTLRDGEKLIVKEPADRVVELTVEYLRSIHCGGF